MALLGWILAFIAVLGGLLAIAGEVTKRDIRSGRHSPIGRRAPLRPGIVPAADHQQSQR